MKRRRTLLIRGIRCLSIGFMSLCAAIFLTLIFLTLSPGERILKGILEGRLRGSLGCDVRIGTLETNLLSRLRVQDIRMYGSDSGEKLLLLSLGYARVEYSLASFHLGRLSLRSVDLDSVGVTISRDSTGALNFPLPISSAPSRTGQKRSRFSVELHRLSLRRASLTYKDRGLSADASIHTVKCDVACQRGGGYRYSVHVDSVGMRYKDIPLSGEKVELAGLWSGSRAVLDSLSMLLEGVELSGNGAMTLDAEHPSLNGDVRLQGKPDRLLQALRPRLPKELSFVRGNLKVEVHIGGSLDHPHLNAHIDLPIVELASVRIESGRLEAELDPTSVHLREASLKLLNGHVSGRGKVSRDSLLMFDLSVGIQGVDVAQVWQGFYHEPSPYTGSINAELTALGEGHELKDWNASANVLLQEATYRSQPLSDFAVELTLREGIATVLSRQKDFNIVAHADVRGKQLDGRFSAEVFQLESLAGLVNLQELTGALTIRGGVAGEFGSPDIAAHVSGQNIRYHHFPIDTLNGRLLYRDGHMHISELHFAGALDPIDTLQTPFRLESVTGRVFFTGQASGPVDNPSAKLALMLIQPRYNDLSMDRGEVKIEVNDRTVHLSSLSLQRDSLFIRGSGEYGLLSAEGRWSIDLFKTRPRGDPLADTLYEYDERLEHAPRLGTLDCSFDLSEGRLGSVRVEGHQLDLQSIGLLLPETPGVSGSLQFRLDLMGGVADPRAELSFRVDAPRYQLVKADSVKGRMAVRGGHVRLESLEFYHMDHYSWASGAVQLEQREDGGYTLSGDSPVNGRARGEEIDLRLFNLFVSHDTHVAGRGSYDVSWDGILVRPHVVGTVAIREGTVQFGQGRAAIEQIDLVASLRDSVLSVERMTGIVRGTPFRLDGQVTTSQWSEFDVEMGVSVSDSGIITGNGTISADSVQLDARVRHADLSLLQPFLRDIEVLSGTVGIEIAVRGSLQDPELTGQLEVRDVGLQPEWLHMPLSDGVIKVSFKQDEVNIDSIFVRTGTGSAFVNGRTTHSEGRLRDLRLRALINEVEISRPKEYVVTVDAAHFTCTKQNWYYYLDGDVTLGETRLVHRFQPKALISFMRKVERPARTPPPILQHIRLSVRVRESERIWIDNNLAHLRLRSELSVFGNLSRPSLSGRLSLEEGYVLYLDRKFRVKRGVMDFIDPNRVNPIVDLRAEANIKSYQTLVGTPYTITITVSGPLDEAVVDVTSDPPLEKSDILALLTVGATREQLSGKDADGTGTTVGDVLRERIAMLSSQRLSGYASRKVGTLLGLDEMSIEGNLFTFGESWGPQLLASKKLSDRMEITYTTTVGHMNEQSIRLDYRLSKYFSVEGQTDQRGRSGMDLKYRLRFR